MAAQQQETRSKHTSDSPTGENSSYHLLEKGLKWIPRILYGARGFKVSLRNSEKFPLTKTKRLSECYQLIYPQPQELLPKYISSYHTSLQEFWGSLHKLNLWSKPSYWSRNQTNPNKPHLVSFLPARQCGKSTGLKSQKMWFRFLLADVRRNSPSLNLTLRLRCYASCCHYSSPSSTGISQEAAGSSGILQPTGSETWGIRSATQYQQPRKVRWARPGDRGPPDAHFLSPNERSEA